MEHPLFIDYVRIKTYIHRGVSNCHVCFLEGNIWYRLVVCFLFPSYRHLEYLKCSYVFLFQRIWGELDDCPNSKALKEGRSFSGWPAFRGGNGVSSAQRSKRTWQTSVVVCCWCMVYRSIPQHPPPGPHQALMASVLISFDDWPCIQFISQSCSTLQSRNLIYHPERCLRIRSIIACPCFWLHPDPTRPLLW